MNTREQLRRRTAKPTWYWNLIAGKRLGPLGRKVARTYRVPYHVVGGL